MPPAISRFGSLVFSRRRLQFRLLWLLALVTLVACGLGVWRWWESTKPKRILEQAIRQSEQLSKEERELFAALVWQEKAKPLVDQFEVTRLTEQHWSWFLPETLIWHSSFTESSGTIRQVFVFSTTIFRPTVSTVVVTDEHYQLLCWSDARCRGGLSKATIKNVGGVYELCIVAQTMGLHSPWESRGLYRYRLLATSIEPLPVEWDREYAVKLLSAMEQDAENLEKEKPDDDSSLRRSR